jgi:phage anti-repressor protein
MNQIIKPASVVDFNEIMKSSTVKYKTKLIQRLEAEFTEQDQRWYIANLYMYINYTKEDFPVDLENVYKLIGIVNKGNAKRLLINNFTENDDYKIFILPKEKQDKHGGSNAEQIMLTVDTFKTLCMIAKTENSKRIKKYYIQLENIYNKIIVEEYEEQQKLHQNELQTVQDELEVTKKTLAQESKHKNLLLRRRWQEFDQDNTVYIYSDGGDNLKIGQTKHIKDREKFYSKVSKIGEIVYI